MVSFKELIFNQAMRMPKNVVIYLSQTRVIVQKDGDTISVLLETLGMEENISIRQVKKHSFELVSGCLDSLKDVYDTLCEYKTPYPEINTYIYIICPVQNITPKQHKEIVSYIKKNEIDMVKFYYPPRDVSKKDSTWYNICVAHRNAMEQSDEVHIFWDNNSKECHFDLGMAFALKKPIKLIQYFNDDGTIKSHIQIMQEIMKNQANEPKK